MAAWCVDIPIELLYALRSVLPFPSHPNKDTITSTLEDYGSPLVGGYSSMAKLVGIPCGIATQFVLDGIINQPGVHAPYSEELCAPLRQALEAEGITMTERVL